jgi:hypothetical protein
MALNRQEINEARKLNIEIAKEIEVVIANHTTTKGKNKTAVDVQSALYLLAMKHGVQAITDLIAYTIANDTGDNYNSVNIVWANERSSKIDREDIRFLTLHWASGAFACEIDMPYEVINDIADLLRDGFTVDRDEPELEANQGNTDDEDVEPIEDVEEKQEDGIPENEESPAADVAESQSDTYTPDPEPLAEAPCDTSVEIDDAAHAVSAGNLLVFNKFFAEERIQPADFIELYNAAVNRKDKIGAIIAERIHDTLHVLYPRQKAALIYAAAAADDIPSAESLLRQSALTEEFPDNTECLSLALLLSADRKNFDVAKRLIILGADVEDFINSVYIPENGNSDFVNDLIAHWNEVTAQ